MFLDAACWVFGLTAIVGCAINEKIEVSREPPRTLQQVSQVMLSLGGFVFAVLLHRRVSGSWWSPGKFLLVLGAFWLVLENLDTALGGVLFGDHPWGEAMASMPMLGAMPAQQPMSLQPLLFLPLHLAESCLPGRSPWPRAILAALFATLLDAAAEPAWLASRLYSYTGCASPESCIHGVDPRNYVSWFVFMSLGYRTFMLWDGRSTARSMPWSMAVLPFLAWFAQLKWFFNVIGHAGGGRGVQLSSFFVGSVPAVVAACQSRHAERMPEKLS